MSTDQRNKTKRHRRCPDDQQDGISAPTFPNASTTSTRWCPASRNRNANERVALFNKHARIRLHTAFQRRHPTAPQTTVPNQCSHLPPRTSQHPTANLGRPNHGPPRQTPGTCCTQQTITVDMSAFSGMIQAELTAPKNRSNVLPACLRRSRQLPRQNPLHQHNHGYIRHRRGTAIAIIMALACVAVNIQTLRTWNTEHGIANTFPSTGTKPTPPRTSNTPQPVETPNNHPNRRTSHHLTTQPAATKYARATVRAYLRAPKQLDHHSHTPTARNPPLTPTKVPRNHANDPQMDLGQRGCNQKTAQLVTVP